MQLLKDSAVQLLSNSKKGLQYIFLCGEGSTVVRLQCRFADLRTCAGGVAGRLRGAAAEPLREGAVGPRHGNHPVSLSLTIIFSGCT